MEAVESTRFFEFLDTVRVSLDHPDEQLVHQIFEIPKRRIKEIDDLIKSHKLDIAAAKERCLIIQRMAWFIARDRALSNWTTRDKLDEVFAKYYRAVSGQKADHSKGKENGRRTEAMKQFEDVGRFLQ